MHQLIDPATTEVDHKDENLGIGLILCTASTKLRTNQARIHATGLNLLLEPTIFGTDVSGQVPQALRDRVDAIFCHNIVPKIICESEGSLFKTEDKEDEELRENLFFLENQESLGIHAKEVHDNDKKT